MCSLLILIFATGNGDGRVTNSNTAFSTLYWIQGFSSPLEKVDLPVNLASAASCLAPRKPILKEMRTTEIEPIMSSKYKFL